MKKTLFALLFLLCLMLGVVACTKPPVDPSDTDGETPAETAAPTDEGTDGDTEAPTEDATEPETEPETRPEINLPTDPAEIVALIDSIPNGNIENEAEIDRAYAAWGALSEEDRAKVTNYDTLCTRLQELADAHIVKEYTDTRIPHGKLVLGVYYGLYGADQMSDAHMQDMKDAYIDLDWCPMSTSADFLDMYSKYGMGVVVRGGPQVWRATWLVEGHGSIPSLTPEASIAAIPQSPMSIDHPAIWAYDVGDELGSNNYYWLSPVMSALTEQYKGPQFLSNMHPSYGGPGPLGAYSYTKYVRNYADRMPGDLMSYDHYMYFTPNGGQLPLLNCLYTQYKATSDYGRDLVTILQINQGPGVTELVTAEQMKYQAYTALAFGSKYVVWANYARNWGGGWHDGALDEQGNKRDQYYYMKDTNADLVALSPIYMRYTAKGQTMINSDPATSNVPSFGIEHPLNELGQKTIADLTVAESRDVLVGFYEKNVGEGEAFILVNSSDCYFKSSYSTHVSFRTVSGASVVTAYVKGVPTILDPVDGVYTVEVKDADAVFITVTEPESIVNRPAPAAPIGQLTLAGKAITDFTVVIPADATERERQAAEALVALIERATGKTLPIVTDTETPAAYISLGSTALSSAADTARGSLKGDGYALLTKDGNLFITGADANGAGTLMGVYGFCEDYLGYRFYGEKDIVIPAAETVAVPDGLSETHNPAFLHREATFHAAVVQPYPLYQKYNGDLMYGDLGFASEWWGGESLYRLAGVETGATVCLSSEETYAKVLETARFLMQCDPDSEYLSCALDQTGVWKACTCEACTASVAAEGTPMGLLLTFVNRLATDLRADYPDLLVDTLAVGEMAKVPKTVKPAEGVVIRLVLPEEACRQHALNDTACTANADFRTALEAWCKVSDKVMVLDNATPRGTPLLTPGANLLTLYDTIQYLRSLGVMGYQHTGYDYLSGEMDALRNYLLSRLLWDADMTREEYLAAMDAFLEYYYGAGWTYIRQYIDKMGNTEDTDHATYKKNLQMLARTTSKNSPFVDECIALWTSALEAAETDRHAHNVERSTIHLYQIFPALGSRDREYGKIQTALCKKYGFPV